MQANDYKAVLIGDFTLNNFAGYLDNDQNDPHIHSTIAPFGQIMQVLLNDRLDCWTAEPELGIVWTRPESVVEDFNKVLQFEETDLDRILSQVDDFCEGLQRLNHRVKLVFVPNWVLPSYHRGLGVFDLREGGGIAYTLMQMNLRLANNLAGMPNCVVLDTQRWVARVGPKAFNPKLWYLGKIPFGNDVFKEAVRDVKAGLRAVRGRGKKLVILDLDDTLWGGIVGDVGWQHVVLGGHDAVGEAFVDFQKQLKALQNRGILLAVVSKNEETVALEAIRNHPEMLLKEDDLAGWRINWQDKAQNIVELVADLQLGLDATVFIDDNPVERERVRDALPDVFVPEWPKDKLSYARALLDLDCFDSGFISDEDRQRAAMYVSERQRTTLKHAVTSLAEWLQTLNTQVTIEPLHDANLGRVTQLLNKTNQLNLTTRRQTGSELMNWVAEENHWLFAFRVTDKFGDSGLTGILSMEAQQEILRIVDFVLSCRVMGRDIEKTMIAFAVELGRMQGLKKLCARYVATKKNKPCLDVFLSSGLSRDPEDVFSWDLSDAYPYPSHIDVNSGQCVREVAT